VKELARKNGVVIVKLGFGDILGWQSVTPNKIGPKPYGHLA
jgi:hypothetical protein